MRNIQFRHSRVRGSARVNGSGGQTCSLCVRHVRGLYDSAAILREIYQPVVSVYVVRRSLPRKEDETHVSSSAFYAVRVETNQVRFLQSQRGRERPSFSRHRRRREDRCTVRATHRQSELGAGHDRARVPNGVCECFFVVRNRGRKTLGRAVSTRAIGPSVEQRNDGSRYRDGQHRDHVDGPFLTLVFDRLVHRTRPASKLSDR